MNTSNIAVFVDVENLTYWVKHSGPEDLFEELKKQGSITIRKAYGNWSNASISALQISLDRLGFDLAHSFHPVSGKNSADIQFTIDVIDYAVRMPDIDCFVLATGDSDFSPLFRKLRNMGKEVIGVGPKSPLSKSVLSSCSQYIYTDPPQRLCRPTGTGYNKATALARNTLRSLNGYAQCAELKKRMLEVDPSFDEKKHGFTSFRKFLEHIAAIHLTPSTNGQGVMAYIEQKKQRPLSTIPVVHKHPAVNEENTLEVYQRLLRAHHWHSVAKQSLIRAYHMLASFEPQPQRDIERLLTKRLDDEISWSGVRHCVAIFIKSGLFNLTLKSNEHLPENRLLKIEKKRDYLTEIDFSLLTRLLASIEENQHPIETDVIAELLYGNYSEQELQQLIHDAGTKLVPLNN